MSDHHGIFVKLLDEDVDVWRPVLAEHLGGQIYRILDQRCDRDTENWEYEPGDVVECELIELEGHSVLGARKRMEGLP